MRLILLLLLSLAFSGCDFTDRLSVEWNALTIVLKGGQSPLKRKAQVTDPNAEVLQEIYRVVFRVAPKDPAEFAGYLDAMSQGASLEGIYNGFTHSSLYRQFEEAAKGSNPRALQIFGEELAALETALPQPTQFEAKDALPLAMPVEPGAGVERTVEFKGKEQAKSPVQVFATASLYTLKRVIGDEALKVITAKKSDRAALANWYSDFVVRMSKRGVDFGLELRNRPDAEFHRKWALDMTTDRLTWEVLNRLHRVLN